MCGIAGWMAPRPPDELAAVATSMGNALVHRGPDSAGVWHGSAGIALSHRRLSIVDLTKAGAQPMRSHSGRLVMSYNGELYNTDELRSALSDTRWRGHSDTEVLITAIERWGLHDALRRAHGMFALAVWDVDARTLTLARDRAGEKPLYYGRIGAGFAFASELKAMRSVPGWRGDIDPDAVALFMQHSYVPPPRTIHEGIYKLPPASWLTVSADYAGPLPSPQTYWSLTDTIASARREPIADATEAADQLDALLLRAVGQQCISDVPLGAFLSGGIDSSTVVALMQAQSSAPVRTFTIGFTEPAYDEAPYARAVAAHLRTRHTELIVTPSEAMAVIPDLPSIYDEPFSDSSQIPTVLVSRLARQQVTVALSGDAGDELFGGYYRYILCERLARSVGWLPPASRHAAASMIANVRPQQWQRGYDALAPLMPRQLRNWPFGDRVHKLAGVLSARGVEEIYRRLISHWAAGEVCVQGSASLALPPTNDALELDSTEWMMRADFCTYLPNDILVKVDRASMSIGLETRVPLLDPRIIEFAWRLPRELKLRGGVGKRVLRSVLAKHVPPSLFERPKAGFGIPLGQWLRGPLRDWAEDLLSYSSLSGAGLLRADLVRLRWNEHLSGRGHWQYHLWDALMLQAWVREQRKGAAGLATAS